MIKIFDVVRNEDETGNSGTGVVARAIEFSDGACVLKWDAETNALAVGSLVVYSSFEDMVKVHGHGGKTEFKVANRVATNPGDLIPFEGDHYYLDKRYIRSETFIDRHDYRRTLVHEYIEVPS